MNGSNKDKIREGTDRARGGDERDSQGDGVADAAAERKDRQPADRADQQRFAQPGTNQQSVPGGIEGSIMEDEPNDHVSGRKGTENRPAGNERRVDEL